MINLLEATGRTPQQGALVLRYHEFLLFASLQASQPEHTWARNLRNSLYPTSVYKGYSRGPVMMDRVDERPSAVT